MKEITEVEATIQPSVQVEAPISSSKPEIQAPTALDEPAQPKPTENLVEPNSDVPPVSIENQPKN